MVCIVVDGLPVYRVVLADHLSCKRGFITPKTDATSCHHVPIHRVLARVNQVNASPGVVGNGVACDFILAHLLQANAKPVVIGNVIARDGVAIACRLKVDAKSIVGNGVARDRCVVRRCQNNAIIVVGNGKTFNSDVIGGHIETRGSPFTNNGGCCSACGGRESYMGGVHI